MCPGSTVCGSNVNADVSENALIAELRGRFSSEFGDVSNAQVVAMPPSQFAPGEFGRQVGAATVEIPNDLFSNFDVDFSVYTLGHEFNHVLQTSLGGGVIPFWDLYSKYSNYYTNPYEVQSNVAGMRFAAPATGRQVPNYFPRFR